LTIERGDVVVVAIWQASAAAVGQAGRRRLWIEEVGVGGLVERDVSARR